jgi:hypothetical protein
MSKLSCLAAIGIGAIVFIVPASAQQTADFQPPTQPECVPGELLVKHRVAVRRALQV